MGLSPPLVRLVGDTGSVRLFVAAWPPPEVVRHLAAVDRPAVPGLRWTGANLLHVTLAFLGEVPDDDLASASAALAGVARQLPGRPRAVVGPATTVLGRAVLCVPVAGLDDAAVAVRSSALGRYLPAGTPPFQGHLTLARARRGQRVPGTVRGLPVAAGWVVDELSLVASRLGSEGPRYTTVSGATIP